MSTNSRKNVAVIGAGVVGTAIALWLQRRGMRVTLLDRAQPGSGCSSGNSGAISPGSVAPLAMPGVIAAVPQMLFDDESPLYIPPTYLPVASPWLLRFVASARPASVARGAARLDALHRGAVDMHRQLTAELGVSELFLPAGHLHLYPDDRSLAKDSAGWRLREAYGYHPQRLDRGQVADMEPRVSDRYRIGMYLEDHATILNPKRYVEAMAQAFVHAGGVFQTGEVTGLERGPQGWTLAGVTCEPHEHVVVAAGAWSRTILAPLGISLPLESQRGYHVEFEGLRDIVSRTVVLADKKIFVTPMEAGLRVGGTVEIAGLKRQPDARRAAVLERIAKANFEGLEGRTAKVWMGHRPCMPDSVPVIGQAPGAPKLWMAVGHGHLGLTDSLPTAALLADQICGAEAG
nr:FAD-dependent oxidoreductase [Nitrosomonas nitrosa]